jgi:hypothetical protein
LKSELQEVVKDDRDMKILDLESAHHLLEEAQEAKKAADSDK